MKFVIDPQVFDILPTVCFGVVVAKGVDNRGKREEITGLLRAAVAEVREKFAGVNLKEHPAFVCYREAFQKLGFNPNKFLSSVEALTSRVVKGGVLPEINGVVDLVNAVSLRHALPMGAHDLDSVAGDIMVRFAREGERFIPFGRTEPEFVPAGELVYADDNEVRTRRWIWRQNERGKITEETKNIFFPIDGFSDRNLDSVFRARQELASYLERYWGVRVEVFFLDQKNHFAEW